MKILVTGGAGFIGSHTVVELLQSGYEVVVVDNLSIGKREAVDAACKIAGKEAEFIHLDLTDEQATISIIGKIKPDAVIHFAAYKSVPESLSEPLTYYRNNMISGINILQAMYKSSCKTMIFSSSATVYGENPNIPFDEDTPLNPVSPYGRTKSHYEAVLHDFCIAHKDFTAIALRYFNPVGAHESGFLGEDPLGVPGNLLPYVTQVAIGRREKVFVYGNDYDTPDGTGIRDYLHVTDLALGHLAALDWATDNQGFEVFNLGRGEGASVLQILRSVEKACGRKLPYEIVSRRPGDVPASVCKAEKAATVLGWKAKMNIDKICQDAWNWQKINPEGFNPHYAVDGLPSTLTAQNGFKEK
ncbi:MAG: UDP-glucose 4-epimerase GalE [Candidatus Cloacimonetes bacterium]|nr:UDP-glucose 4-epimerase GalE [Candidatus Cloacimonadota bacterium]